MITNPPPTPPSKPSTPTAPRHPRTPTSSRVVTARSTAVREWVIQAEPDAGTRDDQGGRSAPRCGPCPRSDPKCRRRHRVLDMQTLSEEARARGSQSLRLLQTVG